MSQHDYFFLFANAAAAQADPVVGAYWNAPTTDNPSGSWNTSVCFPGIKVSTPSAVLNGVSTLTGFWIMISSMGPNAALAAKVGTAGPGYLALDRDVAVAGGSFVVSLGISGTARTALHFSPVPLGSPAVYWTGLGQ
jgi:hypothetical protein